VLRTGPDGRAALRTAAGASLRFDRSSRWALPSASRVELAAGSLYADTGDASGLVVATAIGEARDIGTRFAVRVEADSMRVGVRDGAVLVDRGAQRYRAERGVELRVPRAGEPQRGELASFGEAWAWTLEVAPAFELEGSTLADFLDWLEAETGWSVAYDQDAVGEPAERIVLHGSLEGVSPLDAPALVLPGAEVSYRLEGGVLVIE
jgi:ferric-dicitrate binding protein FerR (iron transport regulator)